MRQDHEAETWKRWVLPVSRPARGRFWIPCDAAMSGDRVSGLAGGERGQRACRLLQWPGPGLGRNVSARLLTLEAGIVPFPLSWCQLWWEGCILSLTLLGCVGTCSPFFFYTNEWVYKPFFDSSRESYGRAMVDTPCHPLLICPLKASLSNLLSRVALKILEGCKSVRDESEPKDFVHFAARDRWSPFYGSEPHPMRIFDQGICTNN